MARNEMTVKRFDAEFPRRGCLDLITPAEKAINDAMAAIEAIGADRRLTEAELLLAQVGKLVSDVIDDRLQGKI